MGEPSLDDANVKVAVRVRPMNRRGKKLYVSLFPIMLLPFHMYSLHTYHIFHVFTMRSGFYFISLFYFIFITFCFVLFFFLLKAVA